MTSPIGGKRLAEITEHAAFASTYAEYQRVAGVYVPELLGEITRLKDAAAQRASDELTHLEQAVEAEAVLRAEVGRLTTELAKAQRTPRCGAMTPNAFINAEPLGPCILGHGHGGMHEEASPAGWPGHPGASWTERNDPLAVANARIRDLEAGIDRVMKMPMHAHDNHWCSSSRDMIRALGDVAPAPTGEAIASLLSGMAERAAVPTAEGGPV